MLLNRRPARRLVPLSAAGALVLSAALVPAATAAEPLLSIAEVQGTGASTTYASMLVTVEGVVTADHRTGGYRGIYVQTAGSGGAVDATPGASDGIFVYLGSKTTTAALGDTVRVTGTASEYFGLTQISVSGASGVIDVLGAGTLPTPVALPATVTGADREQYEGMLVAPSDDYLVASTHEVERYGTVWLSAGTTPLVKSTETERPGAAADAIAASNAARRLLLDDGKNNQVTGATQPYLTAAAPVRVGDGVSFHGLAYVLSYGFDKWRLQPTVPIDSTTPADAKAGFTGTNPRPATPADVGGDVRLATFNVLNYFTTFTSVDPDARGAADAAQFAVQKGKIVAAISALDADVVALQEIENSTQFGDGTPDVALADLVDGLNEAAGSTVWAYVPTPAALVGAGAPPTDPIMNAIIYRPAAVTPVGASETVVDETVWDIAREPIAQRFATTPGGHGDVIVVANHFKSKGGTGTEPADGQGFFNAERVEQANSVIAFAASLEAATGVDDIAIMGDLNSYGQEDPVATFAAAGYTDLVASRAAGQYTYTFDGELGSLDHVMASPALAARVTGTDVWDINADEWSGFGYFGSMPEVGSVYRASDHDPILVGIDDGSTLTLDLLGINDFHGRLEAGSGGVVGAAVLAGAVTSYRAANPSTLFVSAGDSIGASTFTSFIQQDNPTIDALNAMRLDVSALGNHEFDQGRADVDDRVIPRADFPYLAANLYDRTTGTRAYAASWVTDVDGVSVGFIGAVTDQLSSLVSPAGISSLDVRPIAPEVNAVAEELSDGDPSNGEADVLVLLVHEGPAGPALADSTDDSVFGRLVAEVSPEVDAIFSGHTHQAFAHLVPVAGAPGVLARPVVQGASYGIDLSHVTLTVDRDSGDVVANAAEVVPLATGGFTADPAVAQIVTDAVAAAAGPGSVSLGSITASLLRAKKVNGDEDRGGESTLGNLVADVQLAATQDLGTQIAFMNPGGLRTDLLFASSGPADPDGNVTYREAATVQPFANTLVATTLTGQQVVDVLEEQWQPAGASRPFLKLGVAGITYGYDPTAAAGSRITQVMVGGTPLDLAGSYRVVANSFLASGGDNFATLAQGANPADTGRIDLQAFVDYMGANSPVSPDTAQRAVGVHLDAVPADGYRAGDTVTGALSSLQFSTAAVADEVVLTAGGTTLGTFPIDPTIVDATDEVGRAAFALTVPAGLTGTSLAVTATVASTGTTVTFSLPLAEVVTAPSCTVSYAASGFFRSYVARVTVHNGSPDPLRDWSLNWTNASGDRALVGIGAKVRQRGNEVTASGSRWSSIPAEGSTTFWVLGSTGRGGPGEPSGWALNGLACGTA